VIAFAVLAVAFCKPLFANSLNGIDNSVLRNYTEEKLRGGARSLDVTSRVIYKEALEILESGDREAAIGKLHLASSLSGDYAPPLFTLARIEMLRGNPEFVLHLWEGIRRLAVGFDSQAIIGANLIVFLFSLVSALLIAILFMILVRNWPMYDHKVREIYSKRFAFPPPQFIAPLMILGLLIARAGFALYSTILLLLAWPSSSRREKAVIVTIVIFICAGSLLTPLLETYVPAIEEGSVTKKFSRMNNSGGDENIIASLESMEDGEFAAERAFALGTMMYRLGMYDEARSHLLECASIRTDFGPAFLNLGNVYFRQEDYNRALAGYQNMLAVDSTDAVAHYNIGQTYIKKMLFAESSSALGKAREMGIEDFRSNYPGIRLADTDIYDYGFPAGELWSIAAREGRARKSRLLDDIFRPWLLFPFRWFGLLLVVALIISIIVCRMSPDGWRVFHCDNCGRPTCPECSDSETGLRFCRDCSDVISGLSSVKVMEALLRHKRQAVRAKRNRIGWWKVRILPGSAHIFFGKTIGGTFLMALSLASLILLAWRGLYLKDAGGGVIIPPVIVAGVSLTVLVMSWLTGLRVRAPQEQLNYRILPPEFRVEEKVEPQADYSQPEPSYGGEEIHDPLGTFIDSL
jgi:tetratricopeptide (TPR) repeat protein